MADFGFGHRSAANAIMEALKEIHGDECMIEIVNPLDDRNTPAFLREDQAYYDRVVREMPDLHKLGYQFSDSLVGSDLIENAMKLLLFNVLRKIVQEHHPDVIVCTYPLYQAILAVVFAAEKIHTPLITVVTDLENVHKVWFHPAADLCLVPTQTVYNLALSNGLFPEKVKITGIPVHPSLARLDPDRARLRAKLGWVTGPFTVLAVGSKRVQNLYESLRVLNHSGLQLQLAVVAGGDHDFYHQLEQTKWHVSTYRYDFVDDLPTLLHAADCVLCKAGGLMVSETLACGLPLLLVDVIPGQETGNADYVILGGAGDLAKDPIEVLEILFHWLDQGGNLYAQRVANAKRLGRPHAAYDVAELVWTAASN